MKTFNHSYDAREGALYADTVGGGRIIIGFGGQPDLFTGQVIPPTLINAESRPRFVFEDEMYGVACGQTDEEVLIDAAEAAYGQYEADLADSAPARILVEWGAVSDGLRTFLLRYN